MRWLLSGGGVLLATIALVLLLPIGWEHPVANAGSDDNACKYKLKWTAGGCGIKTVWIHECGGCDANNIACADCSLYPNTPTIIGGCTYVMLTPYDCRCQNKEGCEDDSCSGGTWP